ncbi:unnamed protein product, partial [Meganyctiphanes norvegica]
SSAMARIILSLFFTYGVLPYQQPVLNNEDIREIAYGNTSNIWVELLHVNSHQGSSEIGNESAELVLADQLPVKSEAYLTSNMVDTVSLLCNYPFEQVGSNCYYFSDIQYSFNSALAYCVNLTYGNTHEVSLAMLDYGREEDQALLDAVTAKNNTFWVGGKTEDGTQWNWLDGREVNIQAPFWYWDEPNEADNKCSVAHVSTESDRRKRSYLYDSNCGDSLHFICQVGKITCPSDFRRIGNHCYFKSEDAGLPHLPWLDARDFCQSLSAHDGYHSDLAVLGLPDQDDYYLMYSLAPGNQNYSTNAWFGALAETDCDYKWVDGRSLPTSSSYWFYNDPWCGTYDVVFISHNEGHNRTFLCDNSGTYPWPYICQMHKDY